MKVAVSIPDPVFVEADRLARELKVSRSQLYADALTAYTGERGAAAVREKLDAVYAVESASLDPALTRAQSRSIADEAW
jgi:metal-responsive CopG/Arc/MetJ family transcriptional regulator